MPVNGFSFLSEKFFIDLYPHSRGKACTPGFAPKKSETVAPGWAFDPKRE
jgi:hypothetical protein